MTKSKSPQKKIGEIVAEDYRTATVFEKYGIDFCCGGQVPAIRLQSPTRNLKNSRMICTGTFTLRTIFFS